MGSPTERIWPFGDLFGVFPHHVVLTEEEEGAVDSQAALPNRNGVVECHGTGSLGHRLFVYPLGPRGTTLPDAPGAPAASTACCSRASSPCASCPIAGWHFISEPSHPAKSKGPGVTPPLRMLPERRSSSHPIGCCRMLRGELAAEGGGTQAGARPGKAAEILDMVTLTSLCRVAAMKKSSTLCPKRCNGWGGVGGTHPTRKQEKKSPKNCRIEMGGGGDQCTKLPLK